MKNEYLCSLQLHTFTPDEQQSFTNLFDLQTTLSKSINLFDDKHRGRVGKIAWHDAFASVLFVSV